MDFSKSIPLQRIGTRRDVADTVVYLASDASGYITGTSLIVDGGAVLSPGPAMQRLERANLVLSKL